MSSYEGLRKSFELSNGSSNVTKIEEILNELAAVQEAGGIVSIAELKKDAKSVVFRITKGNKRGALKDGISAEDAVVFISKISGKKNLVRQSATNLRRAVNEKNLKECYLQVIKGIATLKGLSEQDVHKQLIEFVSVETGAKKVFDSSALTALHVALSRMSKADATKDQRGRVELLRRFYAPVSHEITDKIAELGYEPSEFIEAAKKHHFVHFERTGKFRLSKGSGQAAFTKLSSGKDTAPLVRQGLISFDERQPHIITNHIEQEERAESAKTSGFTIRRSHTRAPRGEDLELKAAKEFLKSKQMNDDVLASLTGVNIKKQAEHMGWVYVPLE